MMNTISSTFEIAEGNELHDIPVQVEVLMDLIPLIDLHFREQRSPDFYAKQLSVKLTRLNACCRTVLKKTVYELIQDKIHNEAVRLLMTTDRSAKRIAYEIGCSDPGYFSRCFRKRTGFSPKKYRRSKFEM